MSYQKYALAMIFSPGRERVVLIRKKRPDWQAGRVNIPGGHVRVGESFVEAASRELHEETGLFIFPEHLSPLIIMDHADHHLEVFQGVTFVDEFRRCTDELPFLCDPKDLPSNVLASVRWWIGLALDDGASKPIVYRDTTAHELQHA